MTNSFIVAIQIMCIRNGIHCSNWYKLIVLFCTFSNKKMSVGRLILHFEVFLTSSYFFYTKFIWVLKGQLLFSTISKIGKIADQVNPCQIKPYHVMNMVLTKMMVSIWRRHSGNLLFPSCIWHDKSKVQCFANLHKKFHLLGPKCSKSTAI